MIYMISPISFTPTDPLMAEWGTTLKILNEFRNLGFCSPASFVEVVQAHDPEYQQFKKYQQLLSFWNMRLRNKAVNADLLTVLEKLKTE